MMKTLAVLALLVSTSAMSSGHDPLMADYYDSGNIGANDNAPSTLRYQHNPAAWQGIANGLRMMGEAIQQPRMPTGHTQCRTWGKNTSCTTTFH